VFLKPIFGALSDRIGAKPVIVGGLLGWWGLAAAGCRAAYRLVTGARDNAVHDGAGVPS